MIKEFWTADSPLQSTIILLVEAIAVALQSEFKEGGGERIHLVGCGYIVDLGPIASGFNGVPVSGSGFAIRIQIQEGKNDPQK